MNTTYQTPQPNVKEAIVLVVEDEIAIRDGIDLLLSLETSAFTIETVTAENGVEALEKLEQITPDLILSDVLMPQMGGYEFVKHVRAKPHLAHIPVIFLTALSSAENVESGLAHGVELYLTKPFDNRALISLVETQLHKALRIQCMRAEREQKMRENVSRTLQHELRTPMTLVSAYLEFLDMGITGETIDPAEAAEMQEYLRGITVGIQRLRRLVNDMICILDCRSGRMLTRIRAEATIIDHPATLLNAAINATLARIEHEDIRIERQIDQQLPPLFGHTGYLVDCVDRILENALKFTQSSGGGNITITVTTTDDLLSLYVIDNGIGFPNHLRHRLPDLFFQHERNQWEQQGPGVGLTIVKAIVEAHNGRLQLRSAPGQGACVAISLPLHVADAEPPELGIIPANKRTVSVLLVDDDAPVREAVIDSVDTYETPYAYEFTTAANGQQALDILAQQTPDLIVSDVKMPAMDGIEMLRHIKRNNAWVEIPVIFLTGNHRPEQAYEGRLLGVDEYISKPYRPQFLIDRMNTIVGRHFDKQAAESINFDVFKERVLAAIELTIVDELEMMSQQSAMLRQMLLGDNSAENSSSADDLRRSLVAIQQNSTQLTDQVSNATMLIEIRSGAIKQAFNHHARVIENVFDLLASVVRDTQESAEYDSKLAMLRGKEIVLEQTSDILPIYGSIKLLSIAFTQWLLQLAQRTGSGGEIVLTVSQEGTNAIICGQVELVLADVDTAIDTAALTILGEYLALHSAEICATHHDDACIMQIAFPLLDINSIV